MDESRYLNHVIPPVVEANCQSRMVPPDGLDGASQGKAFGALDIHLYQVYTLDSIARDIVIDGNGFHPQTIAITEDRCGALDRWGLDDDSLPSNIAKETLNK